jgi:Zn-dependent protease
MERLFGWAPSWTVLLYLPALFVGFTVHELAHAIVAYLLGDTSQVERKRLSFNPLRHISWLGMIVFLLFGFGWAKPVRVDAARFRIENRAFGMFLVSIAGASANLLVAIIALAGLMGTGMVVSFLTGSSMWDVFQFLTARDLKLDLQGVAVALSSYMLIVNLVLAFFNLFPLPPLDGFQALMSLYTMIRGRLKRPAGVGPAPRPSSATATEGDADRSPAQIHLRIGLEYHKAGQWDEAIARYRQAIAQDEHLALAYYNQGLVYLAKGRPSLAASAFKAAMQPGGDLGVRIEADRRLHELALAEQDPAAEPGSVPPPLEPGRTLELVPGAAPPLDPAVVRRVWLRLGIGGVMLAISAVVIWFFVTGVALEAMMALP